MQLRSPLLHATCLVALLSCGRTVDPLEAARFHVEHGNLEIARAHLEDLDGPEIAGLLVRIEAMERHRASVEREVQGLVTQVPDVPREQVRAALESLATDQDDPGAVEFIETWLSRVSDLYAEAAVSGQRPVVERPVAVTQVMPDPASWIPAGDPRAATPSLSLAGRGQAPEPAAPALDPLGLLYGDEEPERPERPEGPPVTSIGWERRAAELAAAGDLAGARSAWVEAGALYPPGSLREACLGNARDCSDREVFRAEVQVGENWLLLGPAELERRADGALVTVRARFGLAAELYARGDIARGDAAARRLVKSDGIDLGDVWGVIARGREESPPETGYIWWGGGYERPERVAALEQAAHVAELAADLARADAEERDALYTELFDLGALEPLGEAVQARWDDAAELVAGAKTLARLGQLAEKRAELDGARAHALELIFDVEAYFYPYRIPDVSPQKAAEYPPVQREVSKRVAAVQDAWDSVQRVALKDTFLVPLRELLWARGVEKQVGLYLELPEDVPEWVLALPPELDTVDLGSFAWTEDEARDLQYSRVVRAFNAAQWARPDDSWGEDEMPASGVEQEQVRVTNDYRAVMGRRAIAWNPRIQAAAQDHNVWQNKTGRMSHDEDNAEGRTPWDRMRRRGYMNGVSENLAGWGGDAKAPHEAWKRSSGHHRNILAAGHREMASDTAGRYWTQKFGVGTSFTEELEWPD